MSATAVEVNVVAVTYDLGPEVPTTTNTYRFVGVMGNDEGRNRGNRSRGQDSKDSLFKLQSQVKQARQRRPEGPVSSLGALVGSHDLLKTVHE